MNIIQLLANLLTCNTDTIVTILTSFAILISGVCVNLIIIRIKRVFARLNYRIFFREIIEDIILYALKQAEGFDELIKTLKMDNQKFCLNKKFENSLNTFEKLPIEKIYDSFFCGFTINKKKRRKHLRSILNNTQIIKEISLDLSLNIKQLMNDFNKHGEVWDSNVDEIRKEYDILKQQHLANTINPAYFPLFNDLNKIFIDWTKIPDNKNRTIIKSEIIDKLKNNVILNYESLEGIIKIKNSTIEAISAYENMEELLNIYVEIFSDYNSIYSDYCRNINKSIELIKVRNIYN